MANLLSVLLIFALFSLFGYLFEFVYYWITEKKPINLGFLKGPYMTVYGFGALIVYFTSFFNIHIIIKAFIFIFLLTTLEFVTGIIFIDLLKIKLWDYSGFKLHYKNIITLGHSLIWLLFALLFYYFFFPNTLKITLFFEQNHFLIFVLGLFYIIVLSDFIYSVKTRVFCKDFYKKNH